jgi:hypothetical protein
MRGPRPCITSYNEKAIRHIGLRTRSDFCKRDCKVVTTAVRARPGLTRFKTRLILWAFWPCAQTAAREGGEGVLSPFLYAPQAAPLWHFLYLRRADACCKKTSEKFLGRGWEKKVSRGFDCGRSGVVDWPTRPQMEWGHARERGVGASSKECHRVSRTPSKVVWRSTVRWRLYSFVAHCWRW